METLRKIMVTIFGIILGITMSVLVMIYGWGLEPKSWIWIIGIGFFGNLTAQVIISLGIHGDK